MSVVVKLIISGICIVVPGDETRPSRVTCPNATAGTVSSSGAPIPPHYPYLIIDESSLADPKVAATSTFRMGPGGSQLVWILDSASIRLKETPLEDTGRTSLNDAVDLARIWPGKGKVKAEYWDVAKHPGKVSARLDLPAGDLATGALSPITFEFKPKQTTTPVVQRASEEIVARVKVPSATLLIRNHGDVAKYQDLQIGLQSRNGKPVEVSIGNAPLNDVLLMPRSRHHHSAGMHDFELFYRLFTAPPQRPPIPNAKEVSGDARGHEMCVPAICTGC